MLEVEPSYYSARSPTSESGQKLTWRLQFVMSPLPLCVQPVSATPLVVYRLAFGSPRSFADVD
jgi:hypothetical protein